MPHRSLGGLVIVVTRPAGQAGGLLALLASRGATALALPSVAIAPPATWAPVDAAIAELPLYDWLAFTSPNGVGAFLKRMQEARREVSEACRVAAVGKGTATALAANGLGPVLVPPIADGASLAAALVEAGCQGQRILLPRGNLATSVLSSALRIHGVHLDEIEVYRTVAEAAGAVDFNARLLAGSVDWVTVASGSAFDSLLAMLPDESLLATVRLASIGPRTSAAIRTRGHAVAAEAPSPSAEGLVAAIESACQI